MPKKILLSLIILMLFNACAKKVPIKAEPYTPVYLDVEPYVWGSGEYTLQAYSQEIRR